VSFPTVAVPPGEPSLGNHVGGQLSGGTSIKDIYGEAFRPSDRFILAPKRLVPQPVIEKLKGWLLRPEAYYVKGGVGYLGEVPGEGAVGAEGQSPSPGGESGTISSTGVVIGPVRGEEGRELVFPLLSPRIVEGGGGPHAFGFTVGGVRGRGQIYPDGTLSSSGYEGFIPSTKGTVASVVRDRGRFVELAVLRGDLARKVTNFASGQPNMDPKGQAVTLEAGTNPTGCTLIRCFGGGIGKLYYSLDGEKGVFIDPGVGGFAQSGVGVVLADLVVGRAVGVLLLVGSLADAFLVEKKKQFEKVQGGDLFF
jgi:hypothetical protein